MLKLTRSIGSPCDQRAQQAAWQLASPASGRSGAGRPRRSGWGPSQEGLPAAGYRTQVTRRPGETARASISMPAGTRGDLFGAADGGSFEGLGLAASLADHLEGSAPSPSPSPSPPHPLPTQTPHQNGCPIGLFAPRGFTGRILLHAWIWHHAWHGWAGPQPLLAARSPWVVCALPNHHFALKNVLPAPVRQTQ